jgi:four helix bundle protein
MNETQSYKDLLVWQKGISLAKMIYKLTNSFPREEKFGLVSQMRRAAVSVPSNIAEGQARHTTGEFVQFVSHAEGSNRRTSTDAECVAPQTDGAELTGHWSLITCHS